MYTSMSEWSPVARTYDPLKAGSIDGTDVDPHDRAVWRAMSARYVPNKGVVGDPHLTLFIARLNPKTTEEKVREVFSKYGDIQRLRLVRDIVTGFSKGYAFVEYKEERSVVRARREANKLVLDQQEVFVDFEQERTLEGWIPRRKGGGLGGKKESGQLRFGGRDRPFRKPINLPTIADDWTPKRPGDHRWERNGQREDRYRDREPSPGRHMDHEHARVRRAYGREKEAGQCQKKWKRTNQESSSNSSDRDSRRGKKDTRSRDKNREKDWR